MTDHTIRPAKASDLERIKEIAVAAGMFIAEEAELFDEMVHGALDGSLEGLLEVGALTQTESSSSFTPCQPARSS